MTWLLACTHQVSPPSGVPDTSARADSSDSVPDSQPADDSGPIDERELSELVLRASHNSYEGGDRGSLVEQLDAGVRFLELDVHDDDFEDEGYRIGHLWVGQGVDHDGNPASDALVDWLAVISQWSDEHPEHAPIVLGLDLKDDLTDNPHYDQGNLARLGDELLQAFGEDLLVELAGLDAMRGEVAVVYSGHEGTRLAALRDEGANPAIAVNAEGQVVEVHDDGLGSLWYWAGQLDGEGVSWKRHGALGSGWDPAVALTDGGEVLLISTDQGNLLDYRAGRFDGEDIVWSDAVAFDSGVLPSLSWLGGTEFREVHQSASTGSTWFWLLELQDSVVSLGDHDTTSDARYDETSAGELVVTSDEGDMVVNGERITYPTRAFVELQQGNDALIEAQASFAAVSSGDTEQVEAWKAEGRIVRVWGFDEDDAASSAVPQLPATDTPLAPWYEAWCVAAGAVE
ncbi:MAG TPA: hypothetical protein QGF58_06310 [Myxococcota bacterium]|nr:hypothetical protein [Myxococcota bacterium]